MPSPCIHRRLPCAPPRRGVRRHDDAVPHRSCGRRGVGGVVSEPVEFVTVPSLIDLAAGACLLGGAAFLLVGAIGLVRLPDFFTRVHATGIIDTMGMGLTLIGLILLAGWSLPSVKLVLILGFMLLTGPTATHALAKAALHGRLDPLSGRPPRPPSSSA